MLEQGELLTIYISKEAGEPMEEVELIMAWAGKGLENDRYTKGKGVWTPVKPGTIRQVSLITIEAINKANSDFHANFSPADTRRNLLTRGVDLNSLVNKNFRIGDVHLRGSELCDPCERPSQLLSHRGINRPGFMEAFSGRGGLRAEVLVDGMLRKGNPIIY